MTGSTGLGSTRRSAFSRRWSRHARQRLWLWSRRASPWSSTTSCPRRRRARRRNNTGAAGSSSVACAGLGRWPWAGKSCAIGRSWGAAASAWWLALPALSTDMSRARWRRGESTPPLAMVAAACPPLSSRRAMWRCSGRSPATPHRAWGAPRAAPPPAPTGARTLLEATTRDTSRWLAPRRRLKPPRRLIWCARARKSGRRGWRDFSVRPTWRRGQPQSRLWRELRPPGGRMHRCSCSASPWLSASP
mmetsp:Transcript_6176/g.16199  ORF Transcript_6176/g.16199 Transcript_6176/m.16199 type:complete len:247 (+) Transcript_6176:447-1187(+)